MKAAIYCRLSEEDKNKQSADDDSNSIQNQKVMLLQYAMNQGWEVYNIYSDDDYTGSDRRRPEFNRLLKDAQARRFDIILCKTQSRFTRELELVEKYIHGLFPVWGIRFVSIIDNADTDNKGNKKSRQINGLVNEWYLEDMSENIRSVLTSRRQNGFHIGAFARYGYKKDPKKKGHLIIDEKAAMIVREVFLLFSQGYGKNAIARMLNDRGVPNPTEYKRQKGISYKNPAYKNGTLWSYNAIADMLTNEIYIGNMVQGKYGSVSYKTKQNKPRPKESWYIVEGTHEPIIDRELWNRVQELLRQKVKPFGGGRIGIFARKVKCAECGYTMRSTRSHDKYYLKCSSRYKSKDACTGTFIPVAELEKMVLEELRRLSAELLDEEKLEAGIEFSNTLQEQRKKMWECINIYQKKADEYTRGIRELYLDKIKGIIAEADFLEMSKGFGEERKRMEMLVNDCGSALQEIEMCIEEGDNSRELIEQYINPEHLSREIVDTFVDYIKVGKRPGRNQPVPIEIHWNF